MQSRLTLATGRLTRATLHSHAARFRRTDARLTAAATATTHTWPTPPASPRSAGFASASDSRYLAWGSALGVRPDCGLGGPDELSSASEFRAQVSRWVASEVTPRIAEWERAEEFPRELYKSAGDLGLLGAGFPEEFGGSGGGLRFMLSAWDAVAEAGSGGLIASLGSHAIGLPPIVALGNADMQARVVPSVLAGEKISALGITEPSGGSDVASLKTTAVRDGDHYMVNGSKTFITSGMRADYYTVAVRTGGEADGAGGVSLLLIERDTPGFERTKLKKMGWHCSDTATLHFEDCRVPVHNLIGAENQGFRGIMLNFNTERVLLAVNATSLARACLQEAIDWARERKTFGKPLIERQVIQHKIVDMAAAIESSQAMIDVVLAQLEVGQNPVAQICMLKNHAVHCVEKVSSEAVQILGGMGYMNGSVSERVYREVKVLAIGGGATEIMKDLAARQMGL